MLTLITLLYVNLNGIGVNKKITTTGLSALLIYASATVFANESAERNTLNNAKVLLSEAIEIATNEAAGKAISVELEDENGKYIFR